MSQNWMAYALGLKSTPYQVSSVAVTQPVRVEEFICTLVLIKSTNSGRSVTNTSALH